MPVTELLQIIANMQRDLRVVALRNTDRPTDRQSVRRTKSFMEMLLDTLLTRADNGLRLGFTYITIVLSKYR